MAFKVSPDPEQFDEALRFFGSRVVMTQNFAVDLDAKARTEAFWIGTGLQIEAVNKIFLEIEQAIADGESFEDFRKRIGKDLLPNDAHAETVFRNATQRAYNAGRWEQMRDPEMMRARPFWMFDAVLDSATTVICKDADGTILPAEHSWWERNLPPRHHRCRSSLRSLRKSEAERRGIATDGPNEAQPGFGAAPSGDDTDALKPDPKKVDPVIVDLTKKKATKPRKKKPVPPPPKPGPAPKKTKKQPEPKPGPKPQPPKPDKKTPPLQKPKANYNPDYWTAQYKEKYGDAAACVGWGRAMHERALDRPIGELLEQCDVLAAAEHPLFTNKVTPSGRTIPGQATRFRDAVSKLKKDATLRGSALLEGSEEQRNFTASVLSQLEHSRHIRKGPKFELTPAHGTVNALARQTAGFYDSMLDASVPRPKGFKIYVGKDHDGVDLKRAFCSDGGGPPRGVFLTQWSPVDVYVHEFAHAIEFENQRALLRSVQFVQARTKGEALRKMSEIASGNYADYEVARPDKFWDPYMGKEYLKSSNGDHYATEVTSMGYQALVGQDVSVQDQETTWFMLGQLAGR